MRAPDPATAVLSRLRRGLAAQRAYLAGVERLTVDYVRTMAAAARGIDAPAAVIPALGTAPAAAAPLEPAIVLEGEPGATAAARFLVENHLDEPISAAVGVSPFTSAQGQQFDVRLQFEPEVVTLQPREQLLVHVGTRIDEQLAGIDGCWGLLGVPELPGTELVVLVRCRTAPRPQGEEARLETAGATGCIPDGASSLLPSSTSQLFPKGAS
jgi:hypothetical protein